MLTILVDDMTLTGSADRLSGQFVGRFWLYEGSTERGWPRIVTTCQSTNHAVTFNR